MKKTENEQAYEKCLILCSSVTRLPVLRGNHQHPIHDDEPRHCSLVISLRLRKRLEANGGSSQIAIKYFHC